MASCSIYSYCLARTNFWNQLTFNHSYRQSSSFYPLLVYGPYQPRLQCSFCRSPTECCCGIQNRCFYFDSTRPFEGRNWSTADHGSFSCSDEHGSFHSCVEVKYYLPKFHCQSRRIYSSCLSFYYHRRDSFGSSALTNERTLCQGYSYLSQYHSDHQVNRILFYRNNIHEDQRSRHQEECRNCLHHIFLVCFQSLIE